MERWLDNFAYKIQIEWWVFAVTGLIVLVIMAVAIGYQTIRAASRNPVDVLRTE
jgi:putative ABC transport system permease protein